MLIRIYHLNRVRAHLMEPFSDFDTPRIVNVTRLVVGVVNTIE